MVSRSSKIVRKQIRKSRINHKESFGPVIPNFSYGEFCQVKGYLPPAVFAEIRDVFLLMEI